MSTWEILGIEPTVENSAIKKAYAKKLKIYHPEDDPQGFQLLREAYDNALKYAKNNKVQKTENTILVDNNLLNEENKSDEEMSWEEYRTKRILLEEEAYNSQADSYYRVHNVNIIDDVFDADISKDNQIEELLKNVDDLYNDFFKRIDVKNWEEILNHDIMWQLNCKERINNKMVEYLMEHRYLPREVWMLLNEVFNWSEQIENFDSDYQKNFIENILKRLKNGRVLRYDYFDEEIQIDFEEYLNHREEALIALLENDLKRARYHLKFAYEIYTGDPDLLSIRGEYYLRIGKGNKAKVEFKKAMEIDKEDMAVRFIQAQILFENKKYSEAIRVCNSIEDKVKNKEEIRLLIGKCYLNTIMWHKGCKALKELLENPYTSVDTRIYLNEFAKELGDKLKTQPFNILLRRKLKAIYYLIGEPNKIKAFKITRKYVLSILWKAIKVGLYIFILLLGIAAVFCGGTTVVGLIILGRLFSKAFKGNSADSK